jgi:hypothetical protein
MMKQPLESDFEARVVGASVHVHFKPTDTYFDYSRLADAEDIKKYGPISSVATVRHAKTGDLGDYSAESEMVYRMAREAALRLIEGLR